MQVNYRAYLQKLQFRLPLELEEAYKDYLYNLFCERLNVAYFFAIFLVPAAFLFDILIFPDQWHELLSVRLVSMLVCIFLFLVSNKTALTKYPSTMCHVLNFFVALTVVVLSSLTGAYTSWYYAGLNLIFICIAMVLPWGLKGASLAGMVIIALHLFYNFIPHLIRGEALAWPIFWNSIYFLTFTFAMVVIASGMIEYSRRESFVLNAKLIDSMEETKKANMEISKQADKLKKNDEMKKEFYSNITHELKTPLSIMTGHAEVLQERLEEMDISVEQTDYIRDSADHLGRLIDRIISFSLLEKDTPPKLENYDYPTLVMKISLLFQDKAKEENLEYTFENLVNRAVVRVDITRIEEVLNNLIQNAFKYTPSGGKIRVTVFEKDKKIYTDITDTGVGIPKDKMGKLFERWSQMDDVLSKKHGGVGLGLYICKKNVELHEGSIDVISEEGKGTTFRVMLPLYIDQNVQVKNAPYEGTERRDTDRRSVERRRLDRRAEERLKRFEYQKERTFKNGMEKKIDLSIYENQKPEAPSILVLEDTDALMMVMIEALKEDYNLLFGKNGEEGVRKLEQYPEKIELVLSDVMMPEVNGFEFAKRMMNEEKNKHIPLIFISALHDEQHILEGIQLGATDYIQKPLSLKILKEKVTHWISRRKYELLLQELSKSLEAKVKETEELKVTLTHEIRNPVQILAGMEHYFVQLKNDLYDQATPRQKKWWELVVNGMRGVQTMKNLLEAAKQLDQGSVKVTLEILKGIIEEAQAQTEHLLGNCVLSIELGGFENQRIRCSKQLLVQVLVNLIRNAKEAISEKKSEEPGQIQIKCERINGENLALKVTDNGVGISPETLAKMFQFKFTTKQDGTGVGLNFSRTILKLMGGNILVESKEGFGTSFFVHLKG